MQPNRTQNNTDELRVLGLISFVSILVGSAIAVFDAGLWLKDDTTYTNSITYTMGAFTLQGMAYFIYKMLAQDGMDQRAVISNMQRNMSRQMQNQQMRFAQAQMDLRGGLLSSVINLVARKQPLCVYYMYKALS